MSEQQGQDTYLRVQLPNDNTTVIVVKSDMTMWEILNVIAVKKELMPSQHTIKILFQDGKEEPGQQERTLASYTSIERVVIVKNAVQNKAKAGGRKLSIVSAPSTRQTVIRPLTQEFPKTVTDHNDPSAIRKTGEFQPTKKGGKAVKSLSMMLFKRTSADVGGFDMAAFEASGSLTPSEDNRSSTSLGESDSDLDIKEESEIKASRSANSITESVVAESTKSKRPDSGKSEAHNPMN
ncbi:hypothetical protein HDU96_004663 [Phlyctochytrium bullatum]|nr:hypothetical protein HDU96_004663 [Phlyctochytrium bullatum]